MSEDRLDDKLPDALPDDPMHWAQSWLDAACERQVQRNPNSMTLVTVDAGGRPSARVVLCKSFVADPGYVVLYTNYQSAKCTDIDSDRRVALVFHWDALGRQIRIEGEAVRSPAEESDAYFATRDRGSQLGAWASDQSEPIASRSAFRAQLAAREEQLKLAEGGSSIPRPPHWGGIRVWAAAIELWVEGKDRIHDRARWSRDLKEAGDSFTASPWVGTRLQP